MSGASGDRNRKSPGGPDPEARSEAEGSGSVPRQAGAPEAAGVPVTGGSRAGLGLGLVVFLAAAALNLAWLGRAPLFDTTEARHAEVGREFAAEGHWLVPTLNGWPHLTKPPLTDWLVAAGITLFGANEFGARFGGALVAALGAALAAGWAAELAGRRAGVAAAVFYLTCPLYLALGRVISIDALLATLATGSYWLLWRLARQDCRRPKLCAATFAALLALGFLAKAHIMVLLVAPGLLWLALGARRRAFRHLAVSPAPLIFLALALPWFVHIARIFPNWLSHMTGAELGERLAGDKFGDYLPGRAVLYLVGGTLTALPLAIAAAAGSFRPGARSGERGVPSSDLRVPGPESGPWLKKDACALLLLWTGVPLLVFSVVKGQRPNYVMPLVPAVAILAGVAWGRLGSGWASAGRLPRAMAWASAGIAGALGLLVLGGLVLYPKFADWSPEPGTLLVGTAAAVVVGLGGLLGLGALAAGRLGAAEGLLLAAAAGLWALALPAINEYETRNSSRQSSAWVRRVASPGEPVMLYRDYIHSVGFYLGRRVTVAEPIEPIREHLDAFRPFWPGCRGDDALIGEARLVELARAGRVWLIAKPRKERDLARLARANRLELIFERLDPDLTVARLGPGLPEKR